MSCDLLSPITSKGTTGFLSLLIHRRRIWNPKEAMIMSTTSTLPLITIPMIFIPQQWTDHIFHESLPPDGHIVSDEMWLVLYPIPDEPTPYGVTRLRHLRPAWEVSMKVMPLHVRGAKGQENWRHVLGEEASLSMEVTALVLPERTCPCQIRTLSDDLWKERIVILQSVSKLLPVKISETRCL